MACRWEIICWGLPDADLLAAAGAAFDIVDSLEARLSVYRPDSEISFLNAHASARPVEVAPDLFALIERAKLISEWTKGAFDITAGPLIKLWGFFQGQPQMPPQKEIDRVLKFTGSDHIVLSAENSSITFDSLGVEINLGAFGKGHAVDCIVETLRQRGVKGALIHSGLSSIYGLGLGPESQAWKARIRPPRDDQSSGQVVELRDCSLSTSGDYEQYFQVNGQRYSHVIDPRTGWPSQAAMSASVLCESAASSDALSTAAMVLGEIQFEQITSDEPGVRAFVVSEEGSEKRD